MDSGTEMLGITVAHALRKKRKITITTSATVSMSVNSISWTEARIVIVRSEVMSRVAAGGIEARSSGRMALMLSTVLMMLGPGGGGIDIFAGGLPLAEPELRMSSIPSVTLATSLKRTGAPLR